MKRNQKISRDSDARFIWRKMRGTDIKAVSGLASIIHQDFPESDSVLRDKFEQFPEGCFMLCENEVPSGYLLSHPWKSLSPPPLNTTLGKLPEHPDTYYIHDLAIAVNARGYGMAKLIIDQVFVLAEALHLTTISLVAVSGSYRFWEFRNFKRVENSRLTSKVATYGELACYMECRTPTS